jgi:hypothetical protein
MATGGHGRAYATLLRLVRLLPALLAPFLALSLAVGVIATMAAAAPPPNRYDMASEPASYVYDSMDATAAGLVSESATRGAHPHALGGANGRAHASLGRPMSVAVSVLAAEDGTALSQLDRVRSGLKSDPFHRSVSWVVDNPDAQQFAITGGDGVGRTLYQLPGELNGKSGVFEWIVDESGSNPVINHQRFIPGGTVTGYPNQVP